MARDFNGTDGNYIEFGRDIFAPLVHGASKIVFHAWIYLTAINAPDVIIAYGTGTNATSLEVSVETGSVLRVGGRSQSADSFQSRTTSGTISTNTWVSIGGVLDIGGDTITPYLNGVADGGGGVTFGATTFTRSAPSGTWADRIGANIVATSGRVPTGRIADLAIWSLGSGETFGANEFLSLYRGRRAWDTQPLNLKFYLPLNGIDSPERDWKSRLTGTITGSLPAANHAPVVPFSRRWWGSVPVIEEATAGNIPRLINGGLLSSNLVGGSLVR